MTLEHHLDCLRPDVHATFGVTKVLVRCRNCNVEKLVPLHVPGDAS